MASASGKADSIIEDVAGCGKFQIMMTIVVMLVSNSVCIYTIQLMTVVNYNPGWTCYERNISAEILNEGGSYHDNVTPGLEIQNKTKVHLVSKSQRSTNLDSVDLFSDDIIVNKTVNPASELKNGSLHNSQSKINVFTRASKSTTMSTAVNEDYNNRDVNDNSVDHVEYYNGANGSKTENKRYQSTNLTDYCPSFYSCNGKIVFNPDVINIVTEWALVCDRSWIPSFIISIQMAGGMVGSFVGGHCGDRFGRKKTFFIGVIFLIVLNVISVFSPRWEVYCILRFVTGTVYGVCISLYMVYVLEFTPKKWRITVESMPLWHINATVFTAIAMCLKNWKHLQIVTAAVGVIGLLPAVWLPESLRWSEIKELNKQFEKDVEKIVRMNGKQLPELEENGIGMNESVPVQVIDKKVYNIRALFRKEYRKITLSLSFPRMVISLITNGVYFGIRALKGNMYINLMIMNAIIAGSSIIPMTVPNFIGRKKSGVAFGFTCGLCFVGAGCFELFGSDALQFYAVSSFVFVAMMIVEMWWVVVNATTMEVYPTVIRSLGTSWGHFMARFASIVSPFVIPSNPSYYYVSYFIVAGISFLACVCILQLPETAGVRLKDAYSSDDKNNRSELGETTKLKSEEKTYGNGATTKSVKRRT